MTARRSLSWFRSSLSARLAVAALAFVCAVVIVHTLSLDRLFVADQVSREVRDRWIDSIRLLGDLNGAISDVWETEAEVLLSRDSGTRDARAGRLDALIGRAAKTMEDYASLARDEGERQAVDRFSRHWSEHVAAARRVLALAQEGNPEAAFSLFDNSARASFEAADAELQGLVKLTGAQATAARDRAAQAITDAHAWVSDLIIAILLLFIGLGLYVWLGVSRPLFALGTLMRRLASHETDFAVPFEARRNEVGELAEALAVLRRNIIELLDSRKRLASQAEILSRSLDKERRLATEQRNFISTISHEFRTPLTAIDGHAQRLIATIERAKPADIAGRAEKIRAAAFRMTSLVASLMNAVDLAQGELRARARPFNVKQMLDDLVRYYAEIGVGGGLLADIGDLPDDVVGDPELLYQVFSNLLANAFKYSSDNTPVVLKAKAHETTWEVTVEDRGIGIPRDELNRIRQRYYRASNVGSIPGTGMGLYLVDMIVRQHGGRFLIDSEEGQGTRMTVVFSIEARDPPAEQDAAQDPAEGTPAGKIPPDLESAEGARMQG
jgi:two-component system OmpR family sensor kinase